MLPELPSLSGEFAERSLSHWDGLALSPPQAIVWSETLYRGLIAEGMLPRTEARIGALRAEIRRIEAEIDRLGLSGGSVMRNRFDRLRSGERERFRDASRLYLRWGLALMRDGLVDARVAGAARIEQAAEWEPDGELPVLLLATYEDAVGFRSNALARLNAFAKEHPSDLIDLARVRRLHRSWKIEHDDSHLGQSESILESIAARAGGWDAAPPWLWIERARVDYLQDEPDRASRAASTALTKLGTAPTDTVSAVEANLMLGVLEVRALEYRSADWRFKQALALGARSVETAELISWMTVPWDLLSEKERLELDRTADRGAWMDQYWTASDPIWATPGFLENRIEFWRRVGEAWFAFSGVDPGAPGPLTEPGRAVLRFGWPTQWVYRGGQAALSAKRTDLDYDVYQTWEFRYDFLEAGSMSESPVGTEQQLAWGRRRIEDPRRTTKKIYFQEVPGSSRFVATDSLKMPQWPPAIFNYDFLGRGYLLNTNLARFRAPGGGARLWVSYDTYLPDYSVRYPFQGVRYDGEVRVDLALYHPRVRPPELHRPRRGTAEHQVEPDWVPAGTRTLLLEHELTLERERVFRRRAQGMFVDVDSGAVRVASYLTLRDAQQHIIAVAVNNGSSLRVPAWADTGLDASDLLLLSSLGDDLPEDRESRPRPGVVVRGADLATMGAVPRAGRLLLPDEELALYLEVYNLEQRRGAPEAEMSTSLETLDEDGEVEYRVTLRGAAQSMSKPGVTQWNVARSLGFGEIMPGRYRVVVVVEDHVAGREVARSLEFRVVEPAELVELYRWAQLPAPNGL